MRRAIQFAGLVLCCTALLPVGAPARVEVVNLVNGIGLIDYSHKQRLPVGSWVRYHIAGSSAMGMRDDYVVTVLIAGEERFWGDDCFWVETWTIAKGGPKQAVATLMSYSIYDDSLAIPHMQFYSRKTIVGMNEDGTPVQEIIKQPANAWKKRAEQPPLPYYVDTLGSDTVMVPRGTFDCRKIQIRWGVGATTDQGDSSFRTENRENRIVYMSKKIPITGIVREDIENTIENKRWKIGHSQEAITPFLERATGAARLEDFGTGGLTAELVPEQFRKSLRPTATELRKPAAEKRKGSKRRSG